jgi:hypothetical protein
LRRDGDAFGREVVTVGGAGLMAKLDAYGLTAVPPAGWDGEIYRHAPEVSEFAVPMVEPATPTPILHLANFALPDGRGDYGGGAVELMGRGGIFISLLEHEHSEAGNALFAGKGIPWPLRADDFDPNQMQRPLPGQAGCQRFFTHAGRPFCLYVAIGSYVARALLVRDVNAVLATVELT